MEPEQLYSKIAKNMKEPDRLINLIRLGSYANLMDNELEEAKNLARTDQLTQIPNRQGLVEILEREEANFKRHGHPLTIAMIDFNKFKQVNDTDGHVLADYALQQVADTIRGSIRTEDVIARYGGDEFCLVLPYADSDNAQTVIDRVVKAISELDMPEISSPVTISIGYTQMEPGEKYKDTITRADEAMFEAKEASRKDNTTQSKAA